MNEKQVWVLAAGAVSGGRAAAALLLRDGSGRTLECTRRAIPDASGDQALLEAIVEGLRHALSLSADRVTVLCPSHALAARLNRERPTAWDDPIARLWIRARLLSHAFVRCEFREVQPAVVRGITRLAEEALNGANLIQAA